MIKITNENTDPSEYTYGEYIWALTALTNKNILKGKAVSRTDISIRNYVFLGIAVIILGLSLSYNPDIGRITFYGILDKIMLALLVIYAFIIILCVFSLLRFRRGYKKMISEPPYKSDVIFNEFGIHHYKNDELLYEAPWKALKGCCISKKYIMIRFDGVKYLFFAKNTEENNRKVLEAFTEAGRADMVKHIKVVNGKMSLR